MWDYVTLCDVINPIILDNNVFFVKQCENSADVGMNVYMCVCIYACMYMCIDVHIYIHTHVHCIYIFNLIYCLHWLLRGLCSM